MAGFVAEDFLLVRDLASEQDAVERAVTLVAAASPGEGVDELWGLPLGRRNARLLDLRERLFGRALDAFAECPHCDEPLEFAMDTAALRSDADEAPPAELQLETEAGVVRFRLVDSRDLHAASQCASVAAARAVLVERCVIEGPEELPEELIERIAEAMEAHDPQAEMLLDLTCPACKGTWQIAFDVAAFLYTEVESEAQRMLREVHVIACAYGWGESEILSMSPRRRRDYLELLLQ